MVSPRDNWIRVSHQNRCPICDKPDNCSMSRDGTMVWCGRVSDGALRENEGGQYLHRINENLPYPPIDDRPRPPKRPPPRDWAAFANWLFQAAEEPRARLAVLLGVSETALTDLKVGWHPGQRFWSFPERDGTGAIIGINARSPDGDKKRLYGGKSGLTYSVNWNTGHGPVLLPEGGSDTAALMTAGMNAVGRPSSNSGVSLLISLLRHLAANQNIIVLAERDEKPDGRWPGRDGAVRTAKQLAEKLLRPITWALPPDGAKDVRDWLSRMPSLPPERLSDLFLTGLETTVIRPPVTIPAAKPAGPIRPISDWREAMLQSRIRSVGVPGYYLDSSTTGAGKSHVDYHALRSAFGKEGAA